MDPKYAEHDSFPVQNVNLCMDTAEALAFLFYSYMNLVEQIYFLF